MNRGLWFKAWRETRITTALFAAAAFAMHLALALVLPTFLSEGLGALVQAAPFRAVIRALVGPAGDQFGPQVLVSLAWIHPVVLTILWAHAVVLAARLPAEIERGTIDFTLGVPVSRAQVILTEVLVWAVGACLLLAAELGGHLLGRALVEPPSVPTAWQLTAVLANQLALVAAVAGAAFFIAARSERRGRATGAAFALLLAAFFWHVLGQFWRPAGDLAFLGPMHWYRPPELLAEGAAFPWAAIAVLGTTALIAFAAAVRTFDRRNINTL